MAKALHDKNHTWADTRDVITDKRGKQIYGFDRTETCTQCPRTRKRWIVIRPQLQRGPWTYKGDMPTAAERVSEEDALRAELMSSTDNAEVREALKR